jgi:hypothetical protein
LDILSDVPQSDDKPRGASVREASRLRATLGSEPSSGYAFHDHVRVERVRPGQREAAPQPAAQQVASHAPREGAFARTLVGGMTIQEALAGQAVTIEPTPASANDQQEGARISWPPMPQVPNELEGSLSEPRSAPPEESVDADAASGVRLNVASTPAEAKRASSGPPAVPAGGAIWQAMPSLVETPVAVSLITPHEDAPVRNTPEPRARNYRPSAAELEAEHSHHYGDQRVLKYEKMVERNAWEQLAEALGQERDPSPALLLLRIVAEREMLKGDQTQEAAHLAQQGISAMAKILNLPEASPTALVLGKRLLRRNPGWAPKQDAGTGLSIGLLLGGVAVGGAIGWLITALLF